MPLEQILKTPKSQCGREQAPSHISERFEIQQIRQINVPEYAGIIYLNLSHCPLGK